MPVTAEEEWEFWDSKATELRRNQLAAVQTSATKWSGLLTALLGAFSAVAFAGGLTTIDKLADPYPMVVKVLTSLAALTSIGAIYLFTQAAGGLSLTKKNGLTPSSVRTMYTEGAEGTLNWLRAGRIVAIVTAFLVLGGSALVLWVGEKPEAASKPPKIAGIADGQLVCGELKETSGGTLAVGTAEGGVTNMVVVAACP